MRDPARIPLTLARIAAVWESEPDLRLGQLLVNAVRLTLPEDILRGAGGLELENKLFNIEDDALVEALHELANWLDLPFQRELSGTPPPDPESDNDRYEWMMHHTPSKPPAPDAIEDTELLQTQRAWAKYVLDGMTPAAKDWFMRGSGSTGDAAVDALLRALLTPPQQAPSTPPE